MTSESTGTSGDRPVVVEALPARARLFHIGPPKTGTTSLQAAAAVRRAELLENGVRYPGKATSQRRAIAAFTGRHVGYIGKASGSEVRARLAWDDLMAEIKADTERRIWFGHEFAAGASAAQVADFAAELGPRLHVVITLRSFTRMLPSIWQENNKAGNSISFDDYVKRVLTMPLEKRAGSGFHVRHDHAELVRRWAGVLGPTNVSVVVADPRDHLFIKHAFEDMLALPEGLLAGATVPPGASNRTMSTPEIEFVRQVNLELRRVGLPWTEYQDLVLRGGVARMLSHRTPPPDEPRLRLSPWAAAQAEDFQRQIVDGILASGVRVVGDVHRLLEPAQVRSSERENHLGIEGVPLDVAVQAALGIIAAATGHDPDFEPLPPPSRVTLRRRLQRLASTVGVRSHVGRLTRSARGLARRQT